MPKRRALMLTRYDALDPSARLRLLQFVPGFRQAGWDVDVQSLFDAQDLQRLYASGRRDWLKLLRAYLRRTQQTLTAARYDVIWIQRELFPFLPGVVEQLIGAAAQRCILDYDDAVFIRYEQHPRWLVRRLLGRKLNPLLRRVALVTACSHYLCDQLAQRGARQTARVPTVIDPRRYPLPEQDWPEQPRPEQAQAEASSRPLAREPRSSLGLREDAPLRIGWIGSPSTTPYLAELLPVLKAFAAKRPLRLVTIGAAPFGTDARPAIGGAGALDLEAHPWSEQTETSLLASIDVGIMPLSSGPWERGKCGYKLIQYMACAKPVIASAVGVNAEVVTPETGLLVEDAHGWLQALQQLSEAPDLRQRMGRAGRARVLAHYSTEQALPHLLELMEQVATGR